MWALATVARKTLKERAEVCACRDRTTATRWPPQSSPRTEAGPASTRSGNSFLDARMVSSIDGVRLTTSSSAIRSQLCRIRTVRTTQVSATSSISQAIAGDITGFRDFGHSISVRDSLMPGEGPESRLAGPFELAELAPRTGFRRRMVAVLVDSGPMSRTEAKESDRAPEPGLLFSCAARSVHVCGPLLLSRPEPRQRVSLPSIVKDHFHRLPDRNRVRSAVHDVCEHARAFF
jgi:hypothetical protein